MEKEPSSSPLFKIFTHFFLYYTPKKIVQHSRADFFDTSEKEAANQQETPGKEYSW